MPRLLAPRAPRSSDPTSEDRHATRWSVGPTEVEADFLLGRPQTWFVLVLTQDRDLRCPSGEDRCTLRLDESLFVSSERSQDRFDRCFQNRTPHVVALLA